MELKEVMLWSLTSHLKKEVKAEDVKITHDSEDAIYCTVFGINYEIYFGENKDYPEQNKSATIIEVIDNSDNTLYPYLYAA